MSDNCQLVVFTNRAYNAIIRESFEKDPIETGGILLGHILDNGVWIVMEVLPPGINSIFQYAYFEYDEAFVNYLAQSVANQYKRPLDLLGLWHRHPGSMDVFSSTDDGTNLTFARLNPAGVISGLVNIDPRFRLTMYHLDHLQGRIMRRPDYNLVEVEVGDDIIPEEFFELRYYDGENSDLHPVVASRQRDATTRRIGGQDTNESSQGRASLYDDNDGPSIQGNSQGYGQGNCQGWDQGYTQDPYASRDNSGRPSPLNYHYEQTGYGPAYGDNTGQYPYPPEYNPRRNASRSGSDFFPFSPKGKKWLNFIIAIVFLILVFFWFKSCLGNVQGMTSWIKGSSETSQTTKEGNAPSLSMTVWEAKNQGETQKIEVLNSPEQEIRWDSSDRNVATVTDGVVTAVSNGATTITASIDDKVIGQCQVKVQIPSDALPEKEEEGADISTNPENESENLNDEDNVNLENIQGNEVSGWRSLWPFGSKPGIDMKNMTNGIEKTNIEAQIQSQELQKQAEELQRQAEELLRQAQELQGQAQ